MKKLLMLILCLGMTFAIGACSLLDDMLVSNSKQESSESVNNSVDASEVSSDDVTSDASEVSSDDVTSDILGDSSDDSSSDSSDDSSEDSSSDDSSVTPPIIDGDNEMPLVPIG